MTNDFTPRRTSENEQRLSKEEYAQFKKEERDRVYQLIDDTANSILNDPNKFADYLNTQSRLDRYSAANALLIYSQCPQASQLKGFDDWIKDDVKLKKGSKSISILEPVEYVKQDGSTGISYNVKKVFDISQTNAKRTPAPSVNKDPKELIMVMLDSSPVEVKSTDDLPNGNMAAFYDNDAQTLFVKRDVGDSTLVAQSIAQELAYAQLSIKSDEYSRSDNSFKATCAAYMLCKRYGVDTQIFAIDRIPESLKQAEPKEMRSELTKIRNAMSEVNYRIADELYKRKEARQKEHER